MITLVSTGGCGTWFMRDALMEADVDVFATHSNDPSCAKGKKVIYLYGNPHNTILSFKRRNVKSYRNFWFRSHSENLGITPDNNLSWQWIENNRTDPFRLYDHFHKWFNFDEREYDIMFVKYEYLENNISEIREWLECPDLNINFKSRKSDFLEVTDERTKDLICEIYEDMYNVWENVDDIFVKSQE